MELVTPGIGLVFWTTLSFLIVLFLLGKFAWKPILKSIHEREENISEALQAAKSAKAEMQRLKSSNEELLQQARTERDQLMKEARETKDRIVSDAKNIAKSEADKILATAREEIKLEKVKAMDELKTQVASIAIEVAEKIIRERLDNDQKQQESVSKALEEIHFN